MHAIQSDRAGGPESMKWTEVPTPSPAAGRSVVRVEAAGVNFIDIYFRKGATACLFLRILGVEGAGMVEQLGPGVTSVQKGDRVAWSDRTGAVTHPGEATRPTWSFRRRRSSPFPSKSTRAPPPPRCSKE